MARLTRGFLALAAIGAGFVRPMPVAGQTGAAAPDDWRPQTVPLAGVTFSPGVGLLVGAGVVHTRYGFRALPPSTRLVAQAGYATGARTYRADVGGEFRGPLAPAIMTVELRASGLEMIRFYGFGNETDASAPDSFYRVRHNELLLAPTVIVPLAPRLRLAVGPFLKHTRSHRDPGTLFGTTGPDYGAGDFGEVGARAALEFDTRDIPAAAASGAHLRLAGRWHPAALDVVDAFASVSAEASTYLSVGEPAAATLALRVGATGVSGTVPFHELVYVGGETTVLGYAEQRFAGRRGAYANAELRLSVGRFRIGDVGVFGLADAGRVWVAGESSDRWHGAAGGGLWFAWRQRRANTVAIAAAKSPERTAIYVRAGFTF